MTQLLWILTPTISKMKLETFGAMVDLETYGKGVYLLPPGHNLGIVAIHQLPRTKETLWLRLLGRGKVQLQAINQIAAQQVDSDYNKNVLELFSELRVMLETNADLEPEEQELIMQLSPLYLERIKEAKAAGKAELLSELRVKLETNADLKPEEQELIMQLSPLYLERIKAAKAAGKAELLSELRVKLETNADLKPEEQELIMQLSPFYLEKIEEAKAEGKAEAKAEAKLGLVLRLLARKLQVEEFPQELLLQIQSLHLTKLEQLAEALLDFQTMRDLTTWLENNSLHKL